MTTETQPNQETLSFLARSVDGRTYQLAYRHIKGTGPTLLWLGGFLSDMTGSKITRLSAESRARGWDFLCFDYFAHGESGGDFADARVGGWLADVLAVVDELTEGPLVCVGSSMGGHMLALLLKARPGRVKAAGFLAPAADFATALMLASLSPEDLRQLAVSGVFMLPGYDRPVPLSQAFFDEAAQHEVLGGTILFDGPVRILHGMKDMVVPWQHGMRLLSALSTSDGQINLIKDGDHRLSKPQELDLLVEMVAELRKHGK